MIDSEHKKLLVLLGTQLIADQYGTIPGEYAKYYSKSNKDYRISANTRL